MLVSSFSWEHAISTIQEHLVFCNLFIVSHLGYWFQREVTRVLTLGHSLYWSRISSRLWIEITRLSPFYLLFSITLSHMLADRHCLEWMKLLHNLFIHQFVTYSLPESLLFPKIWSEDCLTTLLCIRTEVLHRHINRHIRKKKSEWNLILVFIWQWTCMWHSVSILTLLGVFVFHFYCKILNFPLFLHSAHRIVFSDFLAV